MNRLNQAAFFGTEDYSKEELIAEIGAAALVNHCGIETSSSFRNSVAYIQNWLSVLRNNKSFIVSAAGKAEKAVQFILNPCQLSMFFVLDSVVNVRADRIPLPENSGFQREKRTVLQCKF